ncbi:MAG: VPS10 domain-containing protein [Myxococcales bacterium]
MRWLTLAAVLATPISAQAAFWQPLHEPGTNGWGTSVEVSPFDSNTLAAGGDMFGAATSNDQGANWQPALGFEMWEMADFTWHPTNPAVVWAGSRGGPYESLDNGKTWTPMRTGMPAASTTTYTAEIEKVIFDPNNSNTLLALGGNFRRLSGNGSSWGEVWKSTNGGASWSQIGSVGSGVNILTGGFAAGSSSLVYAVTPSGVFQSTDGGATWSDVTGGISGTPAFLALHPTDPKTLWVSTRNGLIYKSTDGAQSWQSSSSGLQSSSYATNDSFVVVNPKNPNVLYANLPAGSWMDAVYLSTNGGNSWTDVFDNSSVSAITSKLVGGDAYYTAFGWNYMYPVWLATDPNDPAAVYIFIAGYIARSLDSGTTWEDISAHPISGTAYRGNGYQGEASTQVAFNPFEPGQLFTLAGDCGKLVRSSDFGWSWIAGAPQNQANLWNGSQDVSFSADGTIYVATGQYNTSSYEPVLKSNDWGTTWGYLPAPPGASGQNGAVYTLPNNSSTVWVGAGSTVYQSQNGGQSWTAVTGSLGTAVYNFAPDPTTPTTFYVGASNGIYKTTDGQHFNLMSGSPVSTVDNRVAVDPQNPGILYATPANPPNGGVWTFNGTSWTQVWNKRYANAIAIDPQNDQRLAVVTIGWPQADISEADGVWLSENGGQSWTQINDGLQLLRGSVLAFNPDNSEQLIVGLAGGGFFVTDLGRSTPFGGSARALPGVVPAADYDVGGEGNAYHDPNGTAQSTSYRTDDIGLCNGGTALCNLTQGEWIKYQVDVAAGIYPVTVQAAASAPGASIHLAANGLNVTGPIAIPNGGAGTFNAVSVPNVALETAGTQYLEVYVEGSGVSLGQIQVGAASSSSGGSSSTGGSGGSSGSGGPGGSSGSGSGGSSGSSSGGSSAGGATASACLSDGGAPDWAAVPTFLIGVGDAVGGQGQVAPPNDAALSALVQTAHDATHLYVRVQVTEPNAIDAPSLPVYYTNAVELYFDGTDSRLSGYDAGDVQLVIGADGRTFSHPASATDFTDSVQLADGGYTVVATVPWTLLGGTPGAAIGFDVAIDGNPDGGPARTNQLMWSGDGGAFADPQQFGQLALSSTACGPEAQGTSGTSGTSGGSTGSGSTRSGATGSASGGTTSDNPVAKGTGCGCSTGSGGLESLCLLAALFTFRRRRTS